MSCYSALRSFMMHTSPVMGVNGGGARGVSLPAEDRKKSYYYGKNQLKCLFQTGKALFFQHLRSRLAVLQQQTRREAVHCCGIVAYAGPKDVQPILLDGVRILQNRGYDSCGVATVSEGGDIVITKHASKGTTSDCIDLLCDEAPAKHSGHHLGIAHTRWATHGGKTDINAHPHCDYKGRIGLVHNGTIENYVALKADLLKKNITFTSETDTEVIANLIGYVSISLFVGGIALVGLLLGFTSLVGLLFFYIVVGLLFFTSLVGLLFFYIMVGLLGFTLVYPQHLDAGKEFEPAVGAAVEALQGTWGLAILHKDHHDTIICARNGSPLLIGCSEDEVFVASETTALARHTNQFMSMKDGEICVVSRRGIAALTEQRAVHKIHVENIEVSPAPFTHWTIKEIFEQPQALARALNYGGRIHPVGNRVKLGGLDTNVVSLTNLRHLLIVGCGTSLYAGIYGEKLFQYLGCMESVRAIDASELDSAAFPRTGGGLLLLSQSGETLDTVRACELGQAHDMRLLSVVNTVGSHLARLTGCGVYLNAGREVAVASTKAFTSQVVVLSLVAAWFAQLRNSNEDRSQVLMDALHRIPVYAGMVLQCRERCRELAHQIKDSRSIFVLGKGFGYPAALEGALKIKEVSYIHAEGFAGGALKHGPFALLDAEQRTPVIALVLSDEHLGLMINAVEQVKARGARLVVIVDRQDSPAVSLADTVIVIPNVGPLTALLCVIPMQLLAYELALSKGLDPDKPRGLAKTVTVF